LSDGLIQQLKNKKSEYVFSTGVKPLHPDRVTHAIRRITKAMKGEPLKAADIRRTAETLLAALKLNKDGRSQARSAKRFNAA
jgi:hypothetical protein